MAPKTRKFRHLPLYAKGARVNHCEFEEDITLPITPDVEKTRGVKTPRSILTTRWQYWRFFSCSFLTSCVWIWDKVNSSASGPGWVTRMSKKASCCLVQNPQILMSRWLRWIGLLTYTSRLILKRQEDLLHFNVGISSPSDFRDAVSHLLMTCDHVTTTGTGQSMINRHGTATHARRWQPSRGKPKRRHIALRKSFLLKSVPLAKVGSVVGQEDALLFLEVIESSRLW